MTPKFISLSDPAAQWTGAHKGHAFFAYATNYLIDTDHGVIVDVEATRAIRQAEVGAARTMLERTEVCFGLKPNYLTADSAYSSAESLAWLVKQKKITPHIPVFDKSTRTDGTFSRADFTFDLQRDPEFRREVQRPSALSLLDFPFLGAAFASRNAAEGGGERRKIRSFLGEPERPKVLHFASESTDRYTCPAADKFPLLLRPDMT